jgi:hypothetical protein
VKNRQKAIGSEEKLDTISQLEKDEQIINIKRNVTLAHSRISIIFNNVDRITESAECLCNIKCQRSETGSIYLCSATTTVLLE